MNKLLSLLVLLTFLVGCNNPSPQETVTETENAQPTEEGINYYGAKINGEHPISGEALIRQLNNSDSVYVTMKAQIVANCQRSGCWMDLDLGNDQLVKVTFKDYDFVIPLDSKGKTATVEGVAKREIIPVDLLRHYAEDEGKSPEEITAITEEEIAYTFEAVGVIIED